MVMGGRFGAGRIIHHDRNQFLSLGIWQGVLKDRAHFFCIWAAAGDIPRTIPAAREMTAIRAALLDAFVVMQGGRALTSA
jgi:hypothetical protein